MNDADVEHLRTAISVAGLAREHGNHPFGAVLVDEHNHVLFQSENTVTTGRDATGHAETNLGRLATQHYSPEQLERCTLYSSTEPCAMCSGAIYWSQMGRPVYALSKADLYAASGRRLSTYCSRAATFLHTVSVLSRSKAPPLR
jgi:tRNA(Arg) A34 adenosine deaminase TadA